MWIFNRIVVFLLLLGLLALGISTAVYAFGIGPYNLSNLPYAFRPDSISEGMRIYLLNIENGAVNILDVVVLVLIALMGLILLLLELLPTPPRRVRMERGTYATRRAVKDEATTAVQQNDEVLDSNVTVAAQRRPGARIGVRASVRTGENVREAQARMQDRIRQYLDRVGVPVGNLRVRVVESDPRHTKTRVK